MAKGPASEAPVPAALVVRRNLVIHTSGNKGRIEIGDDIDGHPMTQIRTYGADGAITQALSFPDEALAPLVAAMREVMAFEPATEDEMVLSPRIDLLLEGGHSIVEIALKPDGGAVGVQMFEPTLGDTKPRVRVAGFNFSKPTVRMVCRAIEMRSPSQGATA